MKRDFGEIETIMFFVNNPPSEPCNATSQLRQQTKWNDAELANWTPAIDFLKNKRKTVKSNNKTWTIPEMRLTDEQLTAHKRHDIRLNVLGLCCNDCKMLLESVD